MCFYCVYIVRLSCFYRVSRGKHSNVGRPRCAVPKQPQSPQRHATLDLTNIAWAAELRRTYAPSVDLLCVPMSLACAARKHSNIWRLRCALPKQPQSPQRNATVTSPPSFPPNAPASHAFGTKISSRRCACPQLLKSDCMSTRSQLSSSLETAACRSHGLQQCQLRITQDGK